MLALLLQEAERRPPTVALAWSLPGIGVMWHRRLLRDAAAKLRRC